MSASTLSAGLSSAAEPDLLLEDNEPAETLNPSRPAVALSALAKERLTVLNRVLENCVPKSASASETTPNESERE
jgi:hypothetical protein